MREFSTKVPVADRTHLVDIVGTGGDGSHTFNISTCVDVRRRRRPARASASTAAAASSSKSGSADVLEALGVPHQPDAGADRRAASQATGIGFMFAPNHHPAMKNVGAGAQGARHPHDLQHPRAR